MPRTILMGDPQFFSVKGGANPHTRNLLGLRKTVDASRARQQWHSMARLLIAHGAEVLVVAPHEASSRPCLSGERRISVSAGGLLLRSQKPFIWLICYPLAPASAKCTGRFFESLGFVTSEVHARFEGEADFFPAGKFIYSRTGASNGSASCRPWTAAVEAGVWISLGRAGARRTNYNRLGADHRSSRTPPRELTIMAIRYSARSDRRVNSYSPTWMGWQTNRRRVCAARSARG